VKNLPQKYGRAGRHPGYQWYGAYVKEEDKLPHVSDRLGKYSDVAPKENPIHEWMQLHSDLNNSIFGSTSCKSLTESRTTTSTLSTGMLYMRIRRGAGSGAHETAGSRQL
jgi:hypothetical protein